MFQSEPNMSLVDRADVFLLCSVRAITQELMSWPITQTLPPWDTRTL